MGNSPVLERESASSDISKRLDFDPPMWLKVMVGRGIISYTKERGFPKIYLFGSDENIDLVLRELKRQNYFVPGALPVSYGDSSRRSVGGEEFAFDVDEHIELYKRGARVS